MSEIQDQYRGTNIQTLVDGIDGIFDKYVKIPKNDFYSDIYNLDTAKAEGLDEWGRILNFPRVIKGDDEHPFYTLTDDQYRLILKLLAIQTKTSLTISEINAKLKYLFGFLGQKSYVKDTHDMSYVTYVFTWDIPGWLLAAFNNYDILPAPMGTGANYLEAYADYIGFEGQELTNFYRAIFYKED